MTPDASTVAGESLVDLFQALRPRNELSTYHDLALGPGLFPQFAAVVARLRPGMDCWIPFENLDRFKRFIEKLDLAMSMDCAFRALPEHARDDIVGVETLCTTHALGIRIEDAVAGDGVHVFVGASSDVVKEMHGCGWYPVVAGGRLFHKPFVDHFAFGRLLGYPRCCIEFFERSNDWNRTNSYAEAYLGTRKRYDHLTNCFGKNLGYSLNFHIPCRFDCPRTI